MLQHPVLPSIGITVAGAQQEGVADAAIQTDHVTIIYPDFYGNRPRSPWLPDPEKTLAGPTQDANSQTDLVAIVGPDDYRPRTPRRLRNQRAITDDELPRRISSQRRPLNTEDQQDFLPSDNEQAFPSRKKQRTSALDRRNAGLTPFARQFAIQPPRAVELLYQHVQGDDKGKQTLSPHQKALLFETNHLVDAAGAQQSITKVVLSPEDLELGWSRVATQYT